MFSPALHEGGPAKGTRSSRRRQRNSSADASVQQPKAKRQRVPLAETAFVNPEPQPDMYEVKPDKIDIHAAKRDGIENAVAGAPRKELSVRSKKPKPGERTSKGDGSIVLVRSHIRPWLDVRLELTDPLFADDKQRVHSEQAAGATRQAPRRRAK